MVVAYRHEPFTDFTIAENKQAMEEALKKVEAEIIGADYPLIINGERITTEDKIVSVNPADHNQIIGNVSKANEELAERAMKVADEKFETWRKSDAKMRADILFRAAAIVRRRKHEFTALLVKEGGKPWNEADADTAEAIDFLEYYGREMVRLKDGLHVESRPIERNQYHHIPLGVGVVISPWNFLFAIMAGINIVGLVTSDTIFFKSTKGTPIFSK